MWHRIELRASAVVFGSLALVSGALALAQVAAPPDPAAKRPAEGRAPATAGQDRAGQDRTEKLPAAQPAKGAQPPRAADRAPPARPGDDPAASATGQAQRRSQLGLEFDAQVRDGLSVSNIEQDSIAAQAGLRPGDRLVSVDGRAFTSSRQLQAYLSGQFGRRVPVIIERGGQQYNVHLAMGEPEGEVAWLGVFLRDSEAQADNQARPVGARVVQVYPAGPAARAGLRPGDVIQQVNQKQVAGAAELIGMIEEMKPGEKAEFAVLRGEQQMPVTAMLGARDQFVFHRGGQDDFQFQDDRQFGEDDEFGNIPPHAMQLEHDRRMAEQHQRIEQELVKLQEEVRKLREALQPRNP